MSILMRITSRNWCFRKAASASLSTTNPSSFALGIECSTITRSAGSSTSQYMPTGPNTSLFSWPLRLRSTSYCRSQLCAARACLRSSLPRARLSRYICLKSWRFSFCCRRLFPRALTELRLSISSFSSSLRFAALSRHASWPPLLCLMSSSTWGSSACIASSCLSSACTFLPSSSLRRSFFALSWSSSCSFSERSSTCSSRACCCAALPDRDWLTSLCFCLASDTALSLDACCLLRARSFTSRGSIFLLSDRSCSVASATTCCFSFCMSVSEFISTPSSLVRY
mmetsp:Transcript_16008/g.35429  ORF Transcript_16008/g.35429 Transcript_16008/m.35429 type:complete len:283 (-) Transcript_16008:831-1679(-)